MNNFVYQDGDDKTNPGLLIPRYIATGRTAPNGKIYPEVLKTNEDDLVPVRSIVTKKDGDLSVMTADHLGKAMRGLNWTPGTAIGLSLGSSLSEGLTQAALGLKHGGHERVLDSSGILRAPKKCTMRQEGKWIYLKVRGGELKYPLPDNWIGFPGKLDYEEGEIIGSAYHTTSPVYKMNALINFFRAKPTIGTKYFEKDNILVSDCYAYEDGVIRYTENKNGEIEVRIGNREYEYCPDSIYYYPDGTQIKKYQRFCSGVVNMTHVTADLGSDINSVFNIFRRQFYTLNNPKFESTLVVEPDYMQEEIVELIFTGLIKQNLNEKSSKLESIEYLGTQKSILSRESFFTTLSYGYSSKVMARAMRGELNLNNDIMTETVLGLLLQDKLDKNNGNS